MSTEYVRFSKQKQKSHVGKLVFDGISYDYELYFMPIKNEKHREHVIQKFGKRLYKGSPCLDITESDVAFYIDDLQVSVFASVKETGTDDEGSGTLQVYNWCNTDSPQVWVNDLCRTEGAGGRTQGASASAKSKVSPMQILFHMFENLAVHAFGLDELWLVVENEKIKFLEPVYTKYGFTSLPLGSCPLIADDNGTFNLVMKKTAANVLGEPFWHRPKKSKSLRIKNKTKYLRKTKRTSLQK